MSNKIEIIKENTVIILQLHFDNTIKKIFIKNRELKAKDLLEWKKLLTNTNNIIISKNNFKELNDSLQNDFNFIEDVLDQIFNN